MRRVFLLLAVIAIALIIVGVWQQEAHAPVTQLQQAAPSYLTQDECEQTTGNNCHFVMCDYVPEDKTFEEVCGEGFVPGWQAVEEAAPE